MRYVAVFIAMFALVSCSDSALPPDEAATDSALEHDQGDTESSPRVDQTDPIAVARAFIAAVVERRIEDACALAPAEQREGLRAWLLDAPVLEIPDDYELTIKHEMGPPEWIRASIEGTEVVELDMGFRDGKWWIEK